MQNEAPTDSVLLDVEGLRGDYFGPMSLRIAAGECVAIRGPSGAGKTLLLRAVADLDPSEGEVQLDGQPRNTISAPDWRRQVGFLPAESHWWGETVGAHFSREGGPALTALGFELQTMGWEISRLSSGERQRLALLRLLCNRPRVLLLDEPTANLDETNRRRLEELILQYLDHNKACALWVSHDAAQVGRIAGRMLRMSSGRFATDCG